MHWVEHYVDRRHVAKVLYFMVVRKQREETDPGQGLHITFKVMAPQ
jgi:hypothetical protein